MSNKCNGDRRNFLKTAALGTVGLAASRVDKVFAAPTGWTNGMAINPAISNLRVVTYYDKTMFSNYATASTTPPTNLSGQEALLAPTVIETNLDAMAKTLANTSDAAAGWAKIFRIPTTKTWATALAAIKVNCIDSKNQPHSPIIGKICKVLINLGMNAANISIYDSGNMPSDYNSFISDTKTIPANVKVVQPSRNTSVSVPGFTTDNIWALLANGTIDILVNVSTNKGHDFYYGAYTLAMKNHFGTFAPKHDNGWVAAINKTDAIVGGTIPRQQLCIVDSLWATTLSQNGAFAKIPAMITMGTCAPVVDYCVVKNIRQTVMGITPAEPATSTILSAFGFAESNSFDYLQLPSTSIFRPAPDVGRDSITVVSLSNRHFVPTRVDFLVPKGNGKSEITITDLRGELIRGFTFPTDDNHFVWDGTNLSGKFVKAGHYIVTLVRNDKTLSRSMNVMTVR